MPTDALANPLVLPILGLLVEQPRHAYAVFAELRRRYDYLAVRNATVYTLLATLTATGWMEATGEGEHPAFALTATGRAAFAERVAEQIRSADLTGGPTFMTALAYVGILGRSGASDALRERFRRVHQERSRLRHALDAAGDVPEIHMIEVHFLLSRLEHDAAWLERTAERIADGRLPIPTHAVDRQA